MPFSPVVGVLASRAIGPDGLGVCESARTAMDAVRRAAFVGRARYFGAMTPPRTLGVFAVLAVAALGVPGAAAAQAVSPLTVTIAARSARRTTRSRANRRAQQHPGEPEGPRGRHALRGRRADQPGDRGRDSQPNCSPLTELALHARHGDRGRAVDGPWGSLSIVTAPFRHDITTQASVADARRPGPDRTADDRRAPRRSSSPPPGRPRRAARLAVDPGRHADRSGARPGSTRAQYGFGALRCAIDNLNGDNVEWIAVPAGPHVFCYAYYVTPPPTSGTIIVRKEVERARRAARPLPLRGQHLVSADQSFTVSAAPGPARCDDVLPRGRQRLELQGAGPGWLADRKLDLRRGRHEHVDGRSGRRRGHGASSSAVTS